MQCNECGSYRTMQTGVDRYYCSNCGRTWREVNSSKKNGHNKPKKQERKRGRR